MTNEEYIGRLDYIRSLSLEEQIPAALELVSERASAQSSGTVVALFEPLKRQIDVILVTLHQLANSMMQQYEGIDRRLGTLEQREQHLLELFTHFQEDKARHDLEIKTRVERLERGQETASERLIALERRLDRLAVHPHTEDDR